MNVPHILLIGLHLLDDFTLEGLPVLIELAHSLELLSICIFSMDLVKHSIGAPNMYLNKDGVHSLVIIVLLLCVLVIELLILVLTGILCLLPK